MDAVQVRNVLVDASSAYAGGHDLLPALLVANGQHPFDRFLNDLALRDVLDPALAARFPTYRYYRRTIGAGQWEVALSTISDGLFGRAGHRRRVLRCIREAAETIPA